MLISDRHRFIFVHVRKAAGTSLRQRLAPYALAPPRGRLNHLLSRAGLIRDYRRHEFRAHAPLLEAKRRMPVDRFASYFKFGFVRNPWERLVSEYEFIRAHPEHHRHRRVLALPDFAAFVRFQIPRPDAYQIHQLADERGALGADFVGRFERLQDDFDQVCARLGLRVPPLEHLNPSAGGDYRTYYDDETAALVAERWRREVELFGYRF